MTYTNTVGGLTKINTEGYTTDTYTSDGIFVGTYDIETADRSDMCWGTYGTSIGAVVAEEKRYETAYDAIYIGEDKMSKRIEEANHIYTQFINEVVNEMIEQIALTAEPVETTMCEYNRYEKYICVDFTSRIEDERLDKLYAAEAIAFDLLREWRAAATLISDRNDIPIFDIRGAIAIIKNYNG